jgi:hypothetical protein
LRHCPPRIAKPLQLAFDPPWFQRNEMMQPVMANSAVKVLRCRVELPTGGGDLAFGEDSPQLLNPCLHHASGRIGLAIDRLTDCADQRLAEQS